MAFIEKQNSQKRYVLGANQDDNTLKWKGLRCKQGDARLHIQCRERKAKHNIHEIIIDHDQAALENSPPPLPLLPFVPDSSVDSQTAIAHRTITPTPSYEEKQNLPITSRSLNEGVGVCALDPVEFANFRFNVGESNLINEALPGFLVGAGCVLFDRVRARDVHSVAASLFFLCLMVVLGLDPYARPSVLDGGVGPRSLCQTVCVGWRC